MQVVCTCALFTALAVLAGMAVTTSASMAQSHAALRNVAVDASRATGTIKALTGWTGSRNESPAKLALMRQIGVTAWRTHDTGAIDIAGNSQTVIFPDWNASPDDPSSYHFAASDTRMQQITATGAVPFVRLGDGHDPTVPPDYKKYGSVVKHVLRHYNGGWDGGFRMGLKVFEIWNEPDMSIPGTSQDRVRFWGGTPQQLYDLYSVIARATKEVVPDAVIGGPGPCANGQEYRAALFGYLQKNNPPFDFYSYHWYDNSSNNPWDFVRLANDYQKELRAAGFANLPLVLSEWGYDLSDTEASPLHMAAYVSAALTYMQDSAIVQQHLEVINRGKGGHLIEDDQLTPAGYAYELSSSMQSTPQRLQVTGADSSGFSVIAGAATRTSTDTPGEIRVLISNYEVPPKNRGPLPDGDRDGGRMHIKDSILFGDIPARFHIPPRLNPSYNDNSGYDLTIKNLPAWSAGGYTVTRFRVDGEKGIQETGLTTGSGRILKLTARLPAPGVELIVIRGAGAGPASPQGVWAIPTHWDGLAH
jgi:hypothetical protein